MKTRVTVCIGSSCHLKGSRQVVEAIREMIADHNLEDKVEVAGTFCLGECQKGVCVTVGDTFFSVSPDTVEEFFKTEILAKA
ncbi:MAG: (2Fe-2S) ferredoxin domain-containing protein [Clostridia bacterium]|nr:(2Fe-2S) ferredoxin domain-containing protein [Clostridia bacterium]